MIKRALIDYWIMIELILINCKIVDSLGFNGYKMEHFNRIIVGGSTC